MSEEVVFTAAYGREARISADRQTVAHRAGPWSAVYTPEQLLSWIGFYERKVAEQPTDRYWLKSRRQ